jgi:hypothetical protein
MARLFWHYAYIKQFFIGKEIRKPVFELAVGFNHGALRVIICFTK